MIPLTDKQKQDVVQAFKEFKETYGRELASKGWNRALVFGWDFDPDTVETMDDIPGLLAIFWAGGCIDVILPHRLMLRNADNRRLAWERSGMLVGGNYLKHLEDQEPRNHGKK